MPLPIGNKGSNVSSYSTEKVIHEKNQRLHDLELFEGLREEEKM